MRMKHTVRLLFILVFAWTHVVGQDITGPVVQTKAGKVRGIITEGISIYKSIPYAAPPTGELRFAAPVPAAAWDNIKDATVFGATPPYFTHPNIDMDEKPVLPGWIKGNDFLTANVWAPLSNAETKLPVMVYIYGGAFIMGASNAPLFDGTSFAKKGVVFVSFNYRLGIEGFLKINGAPTNIGIRDQVAALKWVQDNIGAFGGDAANVTIFGESAGGISVGVLLTCPAAKGLFKRAIIQSGSGQAVLSAEQADIVARQFSKTLGISNSRDSYNKLSPEELLAAFPKVKPAMVNLKTSLHDDPTGGISLLLPVIDGDIVPGLPVDLMRRGAGAQYDLMIGYNSDEMNYFLVPTGVLKKIKLNFVLVAAVKKVHPAPVALLTTYKKHYPKKNKGQMLSAVLTAFMTQIPSMRFAEEHAKVNPKTYMYEFTWQSSVRNGEYGAYHGVELPFVFNNTEAVTGDKGMLGPKGAPAGMSDKIQNAWVMFAKTGNPGWDQFASGDRKIMFLNKDWQLRTNPYQTILTAWEGVR